MSSSVSVKVPLVALVGRPNVGKSTLFNRLVGRRQALVHDMPGVTRDRLFGDVHVPRHKAKMGLVRIVDTGGMQWDGDLPMAADMRQQTQRAIDDADVVLLVIDGVWGLDPADRDIAALLRRSGKDAIVVVNKLDHTKHDLNTADAYGLGFETVVGVSAEHGRGLDDLFASLMARVDLPDVPDDDDEKDVAHKRRRFEGMRDDVGDEKTARSINDDVDDDAHDGAPDDMDDDADADDAHTAGDTPPVISRIDWAGGSIHVAVVGRPNAGKSSLINRLLGEERLLATPIPGTTRDPIDTRITHNDQDFVLIDTAGVRRKRSIDDQLEHVTVAASFKSMDRADVVVLVLDASEPPSDQDTRIASLAHDKGKGLIIVANKWDMIQRGANVAETYDAVVQYMMAFATYAPILRISAKTGAGVEQLLTKIHDVHHECHRRVGTAELNRFFVDVVENNPPPVQGGKRPRLYYVTQPMVCPPTFVFSASRPEDIHFSYQRYLTNALRQRYGFEGTPLWLKFRSHRGNKNKTTSSKRARRRSGTGRK